MKNSVVKHAARLYFPDSLQLDVVTRMNSGWWPVSKKDGRGMDVLCIFLFCQSDARRQGPGRRQRHEREGGRGSLMEKYGALTRHLPCHVVVTSA